MSEPLSPEDEKHYTQIIDGILSTVDLETVTRKKIRSGLEAALGGKDLSDHKHAIKDLIEQRFDAISSNDAQPDAASPEANGHDDDADGDEIKVSFAPPKKKQRKERSVDTEDADAKLAAMLQAEENARSRATRGGGAKSKPVKKKAAPRKKSAKRVGPDDDSDVDGSDAPPKRKAGGGFQKPFNLSEPLSELCGETQLSRPQVVSKLWEHIRANSLQDPADKRQIICDEKMNAVFKQAKINMFQMNKFIGSHLYPVEAE
ncbi:DEK C terminal domain-containing protein [Microdochium trichocladiopsis]|uniref:DEK C terminal domain-containing protein n=1 Tax=Microdochium trichocladiopsis TaxID=1682393 RepID=A0A9P8XZY3_9PEZI|nr:DEK C terminal domain-containing protein [Microdochium trichocladiopsis]KAH7027238.1 DEK C terminal domain-containing protein [Microdochium trichocladiopsis]